MRGGVRQGGGHSQVSVQMAHKRKRGIDAFKSTAAAAAAMKILEGEAGLGVSPVVKQECSKMMSSFGPKRGGGSEDGAHFGRPCLDMARRCFPQA